ncbi:MAG: hypothetical protein R2706_09760 [Acidimicrobiales bacterium]
MAESLSVVGVAEWYRAFTGTLLIDTQDAALVPAVEALGVRCRAIPTIMTTVDDAAAAPRALAS